MEMKHICAVLHGMKPAILMVFVQFINTGTTIVCKLAANDGMSMRVLAAYRWILSAAFTVSLALIFERKKLPKTTWMVLFQAFLCGLFGATLAQNLYLESLISTSVTFAAAMSNLVPAITLILAASFGLEKLRITTIIGKAKVLGTSIGICGAMVCTFYKGVEIKIWTTNVHILKLNNHDHLQENHIISTHILGSSLALAACTSAALWLIIQTKMSKIYPCHYSSAALMSIMGSVQCIILSLCMERDWSQWKLGWNLRLLAVTYSGIASSGLVVILTVLCVGLRGPVFVASFRPLSLVLVAIAGSLMLEEKLHLGRDSIVGAVIIVSGLYMVLWGRSKEMKEREKLAPTEKFPRSVLVEVVTEGDHSTFNEGSLPKEQHAQNH